MGLTIGIDVGGTKMAGGVVDEEGTVLATARRESPATDTDAIEESIIDLVAELRGSHDVESVGVAPAGFVDIARATVLFAPNLAWRNEPLKGDLEAVIDIPVVIENDANAAAWAEFKYGAGKDVEDLLLVAVGTGIGGGMVFDGQLHRGAFGIAAEIGHMRVVPGGHVCGCGNLGCWEQYASGTALERQTREVAGKGSLIARSLLDRAGGQIDGIDGPLITEAARDGDAFAIEQLESLARWLGEGIASLATVLDPAVVVIGGGVSEAGGLLLEPVREHFWSNLTGRNHRPQLEIRGAALGNTAGMVGVADLARQA